MKDSLGDRMKGYYESRFQQKLMRRAYTVIRIDGKAFHTYTKGLKHPFDDDLMEDMDNTAKYLCSKIQGAKVAFVQSDEISIVLTDFDTLETSAWFDNEVQKICSISASIASRYFNKLRWLRELMSYSIIQDTSVINLSDGADFDARVFQLPIRDEVFNYLIWRQQDTTRNSIQSVAQSLYSPKELHGKNTSVLQEMIFQKGTNWNDYAARYKRGRLIIKEQYQHESGGTRSKWVMIEPEIFTQDKSLLMSIIPDNV